MLRLTFNPGLVLTGFRTTRPCSLLSEEREARASTRRLARSLLKKFNDADVGDAERRGGKHSPTPSSKIAILPHVTF